MIRTMRVSMLFLLAFATAGVASAEEVPWTYVEFGYNDVDLDNLGEDGDGWFGGVSLGGRKYHVFGRVVRNETEMTDTEFDRWYAGVGWHEFLGARGDIFLDVAYVDAEVGGISESGYFARGGFRYRLVEFLELGANVRHEDIGDFGDDTILEGTALFYVWKIGIGLNYETADDVDTYNAFLRFGF